MAAAAVGGGIVDGHRQEGAGVVVGHLQALDVDGIRLGATAQVCCRRPHAIGQVLARAAPRGHQLDQLEHARRISPGQGDALGFVGRDEAILKGLKGKGDRRRSADGVHAQAVAEIVGPADGRQVVDLEHGAKAGQRLVLGSFATDPGIRAHP